MVMNQVQSWVGCINDRNTVPGLSSPHDRCSCACADGLQDLAGDCGHTPGFRNGAKGHALFDRPKGICYHHAGFLVVADSLNACIRGVSFDGKPSKI